jgi:hypothetical protein
MLGAFENGQHFPRPDLLVCSSGAVCDDFSAIAQRLEFMGFPVLWWEMPRCRHPDPQEKSCALPGNLLAPQLQVEWVRDELQRVGDALSDLAGRPLETEALAHGIRRANEVRRLLRALRGVAYGAVEAPLPALKMLIAEMLAIHFCSDREETIALLAGLGGTGPDRFGRPDGGLHPRTGGSDRRGLSHLPG